MLQPINPIIKKIGLKNDWFSKFIEKKNIDYKLKTFKIIEILGFIQLFFQYYNMILIFHRIFMNKNILNIFIIYDDNLLFFLNFNKKNNKKILFFKSVNMLFKEKCYIKKKYFLYNIFLYKKLQLNFKIQFFMKRIRFSIFLFYLKQKYKKNNKIKNINFIIKKLICGIKIFIKKDLFISFILKQMIKNNFLKYYYFKNKKLWMRMILKLRKLKSKENFMNQYLNFFIKLTILNLVSKVFILVQFLKNKIEKIKNLKSLQFLILIIKNILKYLFIKTLNIKKFKIILKGSMGKNRRSIKKVINFKKNYITSNKINENLFYYYSTCFTSKKGTYGIKLYLS